MLGAITRRESFKEAAVLRGTAIPFLCICTRTARRMLEHPRLAAVPTSQYLRHWAPVVDVPSSGVLFSSLRRCSFGCNVADIAMRLALHALPHPEHLASSQPVCIACGSIDLSLAHRYWSCSAVCSVIREAFSIIGQLICTRKSWGLSTQKRLTLYKSIIRPTLTYGTEIWFQFISKKYKYKLNSMQYQILLWCTQTYKTTSYNCVHTLANIPLNTDYMESRIIGILKDFIISRINLMKKNTNQTFQSFFPYEIPKYFRPNYYNSQFITYHGNFRFFLKKIQAVQDSTCFCGLGEQTSIHLLLECPVFQDYRVNNDLIALGPSDLISNKDTYIKFNFLCKYILDFIKKNGL
ncbi:hypothetical protein LAZ67_7001771 [Cordylochernes scorpioides]|uniref:Reverse transcriptase zinc-binding domain-containing protein n=1 Tax=Cordylochernes scorpioides TaxID=51811 RepID=A0ABY6KMJ3_9ARAC|nr:hypothetical protein LAZ67_7001771 [Cordylochernes scorpioides]